jgi:S-adenosylmethionine:tRNA ribosyltransferase-isomerase
VDLSRFRYELPPELIAQYPLEDRAASRMLVLYRKEQRWEDRQFRELPLFLRAGDCLVLNDSRVFPSRLYGRRVGIHALPIGKKNPARHEYLRGELEVFLVRPVSADGRDWEVLVRPGRKIRRGEVIRFEEGLEAEVIGRGLYGERTIRFAGDTDLYHAFERIGHVPLPPYIKRPDVAADRDRYQTVFARQPGSSAAPTAGLHFTPEILDRCRAAGAAVARITLHVGLGTFQPLHAEQLAAGRLHPEHFEITEENAALMRDAERLVAVGTTGVRALESAVARGPLEPLSGETDLFIRPGFDFRAAGALLTNFHLPESSLLMLICAFAGTEFALAAYRHAVSQRYRFYSYGDCMLIL